MRPFRLAGIYLHGRRKRGGGGWADGFGVNTRGLIRRGKNCLKKERGERDEGEGDSMNWRWVRRRLEDLIVGVALILRGFGLLAQDSHKRLYARFGDRVFACYVIVVAFLIFIFSKAAQAWLYGLVLNAFTSIAILLVFALVLYGFYAIITSPFRGRSKKRSRGK